MDPKSVHKLRGPTGAGPSLGKLKQKKTRSKLDNQSLIEEIARYKIETEFSGKQRLTKNQTI